MHQEDQSPCTDVVDQPGETEEEDGGRMVNQLLFEILQRTRTHTHTNTQKQGHNLPAV